MLRGAFITLTSCFGCSFEFLNLKEKLEDVFKEIDFIDFKLLKEKNIEGKYEIAFVEGGISRKGEIKKIKEIRKRTKTLIALGSCACNGCVMTAKNYSKDAEKEVYGNNIFGSTEVTGIDKHVNVDYYLNGCPFFRHELLDLLKSILIGKPWKEKDYDVCVECRKRGNECLLDKKELCFGPITRAGCKAVCPTNNYSCVGCRGIIKDANLEEFFNTLIKFMKKSDIKKKLELYNLYENVKRSEAWKKLR